MEAYRVALSPFPPFRYLRHGVRSVYHTGFRLYPRIAEPVRSLSHNSMPNGIEELGNRELSFAFQELITGLGDITGQMTKARGRKVSRGPRCRVLKGTVSKVAYTDRMACLRCLVSRPPPQDSRRQFSSSSLRRTQQFEHAQHAKTAQPKAI